MATIKDLNDVVAWRMCLGCGACAYICPEQRVLLFDFLDEGIRPRAETTDCGSCRECLDVCPAVQADFRHRAFEFATVGPSNRPTVSPSHATAFEEEWGPITGLWEGHATDPEIRFKGSSGGALTALSTYCLEVLGMHGVLHIAQDPEDPIRNRTQLSRSREELIAATGSRYSPASVCNGLGLVENAPSPCVVIGKPAEIAAVCNAEKLRPALRDRVGLTMSFFCAETPATAGTNALLLRMGEDPATLGDLRYRGNGWPGHFAPIARDAKSPQSELSYQESWGFLQAFRPWAVHQWPDGTGELADVTCGDPWYEKPDGRNPGFSLVVARTVRGREIVQGAIDAGYLNLKPAEPWKLAKSQSGLLEKKGAVWGRRLAMRLLDLPSTRLIGLDLFHCWKRLSFSEKARSTLGTLRRIITRRLFRRLQLDTGNAVPIKSACVRSDRATV